MAAAAVSRDNVRLLLASKRDVTKLSAVERLLAPTGEQPAVGAAPAPVRLLRGLFVRVKLEGQYQFARVQQQGELQGQPALAVQLPTDQAGVDGVQVQVTGRIPVTTVSSTNSLDDANWEALGKAELQRLAAYMQRHGLELPLAEAAGIAWRKQAALAWHQQHGAAPPGEQQQHLPALQQQLQDAAGIAEMQQRLEAVQTSPRGQQVAFTVTLPGQRAAAAAAAAPAPPQPAAAAPQPPAPLAAAAVAAPSQPSAPAAAASSQPALPPPQPMPRREVTYQPPPLLPQPAASQPPAAQPAMAYQPPMQAAALVAPGGLSAFQHGATAAWQLPYYSSYSSPSAPLDAAAVQRSITGTGSNAVGLAPPGGGQLQRLVSAAGGDLRISVAGVASHAQLTPSVAAPPPPQQQQTPQQWEQPLAQQQQPHWVQHSAGVAQHAGRLRTADDLPPHLRAADALPPHLRTADELPPHLRGGEGHGSGMQHAAAAHPAKRRPLAELLVQSVPAYSSAAVPGAACLDDAVAALTAAASQAIPDCLAAPAQHALLVGLLRRELKPFGDRSFRQYTATYKEALEVMAQASQASGQVLRAYNSYPGRRLDGLLADLIDLNMLTVAGERGEPTDILLHADRLVSIHLGGTERRPGQAGRGGGGWHTSPARAQQRLPQHRRRSRSASPAGRRAAAGGGAGPVRQDAQLVPYLARHGSSGEPNYELIGRQLLLSGLPRGWQRDEARIEALVEGTGIRVTTLKCTPGDEQRGDLAHVRCKSAADAARAAELLAGKEVDGSHLAVHSQQREVQELLRDQAVAEAAEQALAAATAAAKRGGSKPQAEGGDRSRPMQAGKRSRSRSHSHSRGSSPAGQHKERRQTETGRRERSGRGRSRSRSFAVAAGPAPGGSFRGLPEDAPLVPVRVQHKSGVVEWDLFCREVFVGGLGHEDRNVWRQRLQALFEEAGATVTDARVLAGDSRGNIAYLTTRTAAQAALAIEKLEQQELFGRRLFLRPMNKPVQRIRRADPPAAAAADVALAACADQEQQQWAANGLGRGGGGRRRSGSRQRQQADASSGSRGRKRSSSRDGSGRDVGSGSRGRQRSRSREAEQRHDSRSGSPGRHRERRRNAGGGRPLGSRERSSSRSRRAATFRGLREDAPIVPVRVHHLSGKVEWELCGTGMFVSGLAQDVDRFTLMRKLTATFEEAGAPVVRCDVGEGDARGGVAYVHVATPAQAAQAIEALQHSVLFGRPIFLRPMLNKVRVLQQEWPQDAAAAQRALEACMAGEQQGPGNGFRGSTGDWRSRSCRGAEKRHRSRSRGRSRSKRTVGAGSHSHRESSRGRKRSRSRCDSENQQRQRQQRSRSSGGSERQRRQRSVSRELATPERSPSPADAADQPGSQTPERSPSPQ